MSHKITIELDDASIIAFNAFVYRARFNTFLDCLRSRDVEYATEMQLAVKEIHKKINDALAKEVAA